ncbi:MAG: hypothetical protein IJ666_01485 [Ruminococcus sp.]|nr:hypothetical protein [Ruminococcus sp.]
MEEPVVLRTTKIGNGFVKEDVLKYLEQLNSEIKALNDKRRRVGLPPVPLNVKNSVKNFRNTKIGGGFVKDDVLICLDEINNKKYALEESIKSAEAFFSEDYDNTSDTSDFFQSAEEESAEEIPGSKINIQKPAPVVTGSTAFGMPRPEPSQPVQNSAESAVAFIYELNSKVERLEQENQKLKQENKMLEEKAAEYEKKLSAITGLISGQKN